MESKSRGNAGHLVWYLVMFLFLGGCATNPISYDTVEPVARGALFEYPYFNDQVTAPSPKTV
jgi:hypothetical protein